MFDLEQSIAEWRQQMLAAGVQSPVPLEELEAHLREEVERQLKSGEDAQMAFHTTVSQIGQPKELKTEFAKGRGLLFWLGADTITRINCILGMLWLAICFWGFVLGWRNVFSVSWDVSWSGRPVCFFLLVIYAAGILGSILLIRGTKLGRWIVGIMAVLTAMISLFMLIGLIPTDESFLRIGVNLPFFVFTIWRMFLAPSTYTKIAEK